MKKRLTIILIVAMLAMSFNSHPVSGDQLDDIIAAGKIVIGADTTYPPFEFLNDSQVAVGFDVDLAKEIASRLNVTAEIKTVNWDTIIPQLKNGEFDIILSAMTITEDRAKEIDFTRPYYNSSQAIMVAAGNPKNIQGESDLTRNDIVVGVQRGTTSDFYITNKTSEDNILRLDDFTLLYEKLELGEIDVILGDFPVVAYAVKTGQVNGEVVTTFGSVEQFGIGVKKGETRLLDKLNEILNAMLDDGTYDEIFGRWFSTGASGESSQAETQKNPFDQSSFVLGLVFLSIAAIVRRRRKVKA